MGPSTPLRQTPHACTRKRGSYNGTVVFQGLTASSFTLTSLNGGGINGIQILQVPEPGAFGLALLAVIGMLLVRGRGTRAAKGALTHGAGTITSPARTYCLKSIP